MPLPSFLKRKPAAPATPERGGDDGPVIEAARTRARRRLVGAVVLLAVGVIGFPLIFETQPRPIAVDIPIETPKREPAPAPAATRPAPPRPVVAEAPADPPPPPAASAPAAAPEPAPAPPVAVAEVPKPAPKAAAAAASAAPAVAKAAADGARAKALLDGGAASAPKAPRFIVQVGAYTDAESVREARAKVEKLGMTSYTQVIDASGTKRTRVRVGPFPSKEEADAASAKLKGAGLPVHVLTL